MNKELLIIGSYFSESLQSYSWSSELPNLSDFDTIVLDTTKILHSLLMAGKLKHLGEKRYYLPKIYEGDKKIQSNIQLVKDKLLEILAFDVTVYALYLPEANILYKSAGGIYGKGDYWSFFDTNDWCPIQLDIEHEKGKFINIRDDSLQGYFKDFKGWEYYFIQGSLDIELLQRYYSEQVIHPILSPIAVNKVDKPIAVKFIPVFFPPGTEHFELEKAHFGGKLNILPVIDPYHTESLIESLLRVSKIVEVVPPPHWVKTIEIPGEAKIKRKMDTEHAELIRIENKFKESMNSLSNLQKMKRILYETGLNLQELVKLTLVELGIKVKPSKVTDEFIIEISGNEALIEVKGNVKSITKDDVAQLVTDQMEHLKQTDQEINGILIGNAWRLEIPENRDVSNKPIFSRDAIRVAENHNIGLLSTTELFKAYCQILEDPTQKDEVLNKIIGGVSVIKL